MYSWLRSKLADFRKRAAADAPEDSARHVISFALWGADERYTRGAVENAMLQPVVYPGWVCRFYYARDVPLSVLQRLRSLGAELVAMPPTVNGWAGLTWRFRASAQPGTVIVRDADSRPSRREAVAVREWLTSGRAFHVMRDHPWHTVPILGGMWGYTGRGVRGLGRALDRWKGAGKGHDQDFLAQWLWPRARKDVLIHDEVVWPDARNTQAFPLPRADDRFVGEVIGPDGAPLNESWKVLRDHRSLP